MLMQRLKCPEITTVYPLNPRADIPTTIARIQAKLAEYGVISEREQEFLKQFGKTDQKQAFS